jgi:hypothetical protein
MTDYPYKGIYGTQHQVGQDLLLERLFRALRWLWMGGFARKCIHATIINVSTRVRRYA